MEYCTKCKVVKMMPDAVMPFKPRLSDVGYDLTIIGQKKQITSTCALYHTGISIQVQKGMYAEIVPRSSLIKSGYMLANSIGIIDNSYTGELLVALQKVDFDAAPIEFPFRGFQLIFRKQEYVQMVECGDLEETDRGSGGFGSTN